MSSTFFSLYPNVKITQGVRQSFVADLFNEKGIVIPNTMAEFVQYYQRKVSLEELKEEYSTHEFEVLLGYYKVLVENDLIFSGSKAEVELFAVKDESIDSTTPFDFLDSIIERDQESNQTLPLLKILEKLDDLHIKYFEIRYLEDHVFNKELNILLDFMNKSSLEAIHVMVPFNAELNAILRDIIPQKLLKVTFYNTKTKEEPLSNNLLTINYSSQTSVKEDMCGNISSDFFLFNIPFFQQSLTTNTCLNKKISVTKKGMVKNCPSCSYSPGEVMETPLSKLVDDAKFTALWNITKDQIDVCKDCEFRNVCSDCRLHVMGKEYSKPSKCDYNPYIGKWKGEEGYLTLRECGVYYDDGEFIINHEKITAINDQIWE